MASAQWWAVKVHLERTGRTLIEYIEADNRQGALAAGGPGATIAGGPYQSQKQAEGKVPQGSHGTTKSHSGDPVINATKQNPLGWLGGIGGDIASGIEGGVVAVLKDIWHVIQGPLLVLLGIGIALAVLTIYFKNDIMALGGAAAGAAAMAA